MEEGKLAPQVFISHSSIDKKYAFKFAKKIEAIGYRVWLDALVLSPGDSIVQRIERGIEESDYILILYSSAARESYWVQRELEMAIEQSSKRNTPIIPIQLESDSIRSFFSGILYIDLEKIGFENAWLQLAKFLIAEQKPLHKLPIPVRKSLDEDTQCFNDCVDNLNDASRRQLRKALNKCLDRNSLAELWYDLFGTKMQDFLPNDPLPNCIIEVLDRLDRQSRLPDLLEIVCEDHCRAMNRLFS